MGRQRTLVAAILTSFKIVTSNVQGGYILCENPLYGTMRLMRVKCCAQELRFKPYTLLWCSHRKLSSVSCSLYPCILQNFILGVVMFFSLHIDNSRAPRDISTR